MPLPIVPAPTIPIDSIMDNSVIECLPAPLSECRSHR
jgi:hypothetical protein